MSVSSPLAPQCAHHAEGELASPTCSSAAGQELLSLTHQRWPSCIRLHQGTTLRAWGAGHAGGCQEMKLLPDGAEVSSEWAGVGDVGVCLEEWEGVHEVRHSSVRFRGCGRQGEVVLLMSTTGSGLLPGVTGIQVRAGRESIQLTAACEVRFQGPCMDHMVTNLLMTSLVAWRLRAELSPSGVGEHPPIRNQRERGRCSHPWGGLNRSRRSASSRRAGSGSSLDI